MAEGKKIKLEGSVDFYKRLELVKAELAKMPAGSLVCAKRNGKICYFNSVTTNKKTKRTLITNHTEILRTLCRKAYLQSEENLLERNILEIEKACQKFVDPSPEAIIENMPKRFSQFPVGYFLSNPNTDAWENQPYEKSTYKPEGKTQCTSRGLMVRSKSEVLIAEQLYNSNIKFRYEEILHIEGRTLIPDFTIKREDDKLIYWEHCGLTSDEQYMSHHFDKMKIYIKGGIVPWNNLIVTYDDENGNINLQNIVNEIETKLLDCK